MITEKDLQDVVDSMFKAVIDTIYEKLKSPYAFDDPMYHKAIGDCANAVMKLKRKTKDQLSKRLNGDN